MSASAILLRAAAAAAAVVLVGCAQPPKPLYNWAVYDVAVYQHLKTEGSDPGARIAQLEAQIEKNAATGLACPPGMHGHLALLYAKTGDDASARKHLEAERTKFPESAAYVDFLLKNTSKTVAANKS